LIENSLLPASPLSIPFDRYDLATPPGDGENTQNLPSQEKNAPSNSPVTVRLIGYTRCSTQGQVESGLGLDAQKAAILAYAVGAGRFLAQLFEDAAVSGAAGLSERPGLTALLVELRAGDLVVVARRDRIARDALLARLIEAAIEKKGARLVSAAGEGSGDEPTDRLLRTILDGFSEFERDSIRSRTKAALAVKKGRGEKTGGAPPFGYRLGPDGKTLEVNPSEAQTIIEARKLHMGGRSLRQVAAELYATGHRTRKGGPFEASQVKRMLKP